jgi:hypothetical protein
VHQTICDITGSDGYGLVAAYAVAGAQVASPYRRRDGAAGGRAHYQDRTGEQSLGHCAWMARIPEGAISPIRFSISADSSWRTSPGAASGGFRAATFGPKSFRRSGEFYEEHAGIIESNRGPCPLWTF